jgi:hypothetical protein
MAQLQNCSHLVTVEDTISFYASYKVVAPGKVSPEICMPCKTLTKIKEAGKIISHEK